MDPTETQKMASNDDWYYAKDNQQLGPVSAAELKRLSSSGELAESDLIWKEGWDDWRAAGTIKGLFDSARPIRPVPPLVPLSADVNQPSSANISATVKSDFSDFVSSAKRVKDLAVAHARKTQLNTTSLPKAYLELGKEVFTTERFREEFSDLFQRITDTNNEIARVKATASEGPQATDLKGKLKSGAAKLMAQGKAATLSIQRESLVRELGKKSFEKHGVEAGSPDLTSSITAVVKQVAQMDARINTTSSSQSVPLWQRIPLAVILTVGCFPVGLYLLWYNPRISRRTKLVWGGGLACLLILGGIITRIEIENAKAELAAASQLWSADDKPAAISKYRALVNRHFLGIPQSERSVIIGRVIDFDAESGNDLSVAELLKIADEEQVVPTLASEKARQLQANHLAEKKRLAESQALTEKTAQEATPSRNRQENTSSTKQTDNKRTLDSSFSGISALDFCDDYNNTTAGWKKYGNKTIAIRGPVLSVGEEHLPNISKKHYVMQIGGRRGPRGYTTWVYCMTDEATAATVSNGQVVTVKGKVHKDASHSDFPVMSDCKVSF